MCLEVAQSCRNREKHIKCSPSFAEPVLFNWLGNEVGGVGFIAGSDEMVPLGKPDGAPWLAPVSLMVL